MGKKKRTDWQNAWQDAAVSVTALAFDTSAGPARGAFERAKADAEVRRAQTSQGAGVARMMGKFAALFAGHAVALRVLEARHGAPAGLAETFKDGIPLLALRIFDATRDSVHTLAKVLHTGRDLTAEDVAALVGSNPDVARAREMVRAELVAVAMAEGAREVA